MSTTGTKIEGKVEELGGKLKKGVGQAINDPQMEAEGKGHEVEGKAKVAGAETVERAKGKVEEVAGKVMTKVGTALGDKDTQKDGALHEERGVDRQLKNS